MRKMQGDDKNEREQDHEGRSVRASEKYNKDPFHIRHALTVEGVMRWYAKELGYADEEEYWGIVGLLHDIDFELYPEEHCKKAPELLNAGGVGDDMIYSICSHGYGICVDVEPVHEMEKVLFAADELTGLIWSAALMRPSKSVMDMEVSSLKKKFKDKNSPRAARAMLSARARRDSAGSLKSSSDRRYSPCAHARAMSTASWRLTRHKTAAVPA